VSPAYPEWASWKPCPCQLSLAASGTVPRIPVEAPKRFFVPRGDIAIAAERGHATRPKRPAQITRSQAITFDSVDPAFSGEMTMMVTFEDRDGGTEVTLLFENIPSGIRPEDNEAGTRSSLEKLARYIE
jgi:hypothetical protein